MPGNLQPAQPEYKVVASSVSHNDAPDGFLPASVAPGSNAQPSTPAVGKMPTETRPKEIGGRNGPEPTRFGDWERNGRCIDF